MEKCIHGQECQGLEREVSMQVKEGHFCLWQDQPARHPHPTLSAFAGFSSQVTIGGCNVLASPTAFGDMILAIFCN